MADTKALRRRIEDQIKALQEKLHAIELVEQMSRELGVYGEPIGKSLDPVSEERARLLENMSIAELCRLIVKQKGPGKTWTPEELYNEVKSGGKPGATRAAVYVALRRMAGDGVLEVRKNLGGKVKYIAKQ